MRSHSSLRSGMAPLPQSLGTTLALWSHPGVRKRYPGQDRDISNSIGTGPDSIPNGLQRGERQLPEGDAVVVEAVTGTARTMNRCGAGPW